MINLIKLQPSLSIVLVAFHATEIQCIKQGYGVTHDCVQQSACKVIQILITIDYFNSLRFFHFQVGRRYAVSECPLIINALVMSKLYYCSTVWSNTSATNIKKLRAVQNFACGILTNTGRYDHALQYAPGQCV
jgi:hypothetical protein